MAATEVRSEAPSLAASPRISFSHDLSQYDVVPVEPRHSRQNSTGIDFNFSVIHENLDHESFSADELFSDGKLLPSQMIKTKPIIIPPCQAHQSEEENPENSKTEDSKASEEKQSKTTSFWPFKRSLSGGGGGYRRGFCPPLPSLSRSHSTGSASVSCSKTVGFSKPLSSSVNSPARKASKTTLFLTENWQRNLFSTASKSEGNTCCKPPLKKKGSGHYGGYGKGVRVSPILNVPSANLFGLGSIFSNAKARTGRNEH